MPNEWRHESEDLEGYEVLDASDTLDGAPGDDPLDRGVVTPERWSAGMRFGATAGEQRVGESLDQLLAEEEPDVLADAVDGRPADIGWDENALAEDIDRLLLEQGPDPRTGRLVSDEAGPLAPEDDLVARDAGLDGGGATAEEAAVHLLTDDAGLRSAE